MKDYSFGNYICALRTGLGLSQFQLGTLLGVTDKAVSKWENGDAKPRLATCYRLAEVLGVSVNELLSCEQYAAQSARKELDEMNSELWEEVYDRLSVYGKEPPAACWSRLASEETALQGTDAIQGFAVLGKIAEEAKKHNTLVVIGGAINSSFTAWLLGATSVNPLKPHYRCPNCGKTEFVTGVADGFDLPSKKCSCGELFCRDGHDIPYEGYAKMERTGTNAELRVSEKFKPTAVNVLKEFYRGKADLFPVKLDDMADTEVERYVILPRDKSKPALDADGYWHVDSGTFWQWNHCQTTFTFIVSKHLNEFQRVLDTAGMPLPDPQAYIDPKIAESLYKDRCEKLPFITEKLSGQELHNFDLLMRMDALSHATGAWEENAEHLVQSGKAVFGEIPVTREDIYNQISQALAQQGVQDKGFALQVMEQTRKGRYYKTGLPEQTKRLLQSLELSRWYPDYLEKVRYLFPKGHCVAYLQADMIRQWYRINN